MSVFGNGRLCAAGDEEDVVRLVGFDVTGRGELVFDLSELRPDLHMAFIPLRIQT